MFRSWFTDSKGEHLQTPFGVCNTVEDNKRGFQWVWKPVSKYATFALQLQMIGISVDKCQQVWIKIEWLITDQSNHNKRIETINKWFTSRSPEGELWRLSTFDIELWRRSQGSFLMWYVDTRLKNNAELPSAARCRLALSRWKSLPEKRRESYLAEGVRQKRRERVI